MPSYLQRTMKLFKELDFLVEKVEYYNAHAGVRHDLYGFIDVLALHPAYGSMAVQVCGPSDFAPHVKKILGPRREALILWLCASPHNRCILIGWRKLKKGGWTPRIKEFHLGSEDLPEMTAEVLTRLREGKNPLAPDWL